MSEPQVKTRYAVGFLIDSHAKVNGPNSGDRRVLLIRKNKPDWQQGLLNGVGGHVEDNETGLDAMIREFKEEAGLDGLAWENFANLSGPYATVHAFRCFAAPRILDAAYSRTDEKLELHWLAELDYSETVSSLAWMVPVAAHASLDAPVQAGGAL